jgi:hypothetical protein
MLALIEHLQTNGVKQCNVCVQMPAERKDDAARSERVDFLEFYKRYGFRLQPPTTGNQPTRGDTSITLVLSL